MLLPWRHDHLAGKLASFYSSAPVSLPFAAVAGLTFPAADLMRVAAIVDFILHANLFKVEEAVSTRLDRPRAGSTFKITCLCGHPSCSSSQSTAKRGKEGGPVPEQAPDGFGSAG